MITSVEYPDEYSFIGNPMIIKVNGDSFGEVIFSITVEDVKVMDLSYFLSGSGSSYKASFDIAKILASFFDKYSSSGNGVITEVENFALNYSVSIKDYLKPAFLGKAFCGGISNINYSRLKSMGLNMFTYRLNNAKSQFFFTTRTNSNQLIIRESELHPLLFIHPGKPIKVITAGGRHFVLEILPQDTICSFDIEVLRQTIYETYKELPSFFIIEIDGIQCFNIILTPNEISEDSHILKFRNSLAAYECIEVTGTATNKFTFSEEDSWLTKTSDNYFEKNRSRVASKKQITVSLGYKTRDELIFSLDLIKSDDIYLIDSKDPQHQEYRYYIKPEDITIPKGNLAPNSITLNLYLATDDVFESPDIVFDYTNALFHNLTGSGRPQLDGFGFIYGDDFPFYAE